MSFSFFLLFIIVCNHFLPQTPTSIERTLLRMGTYELRERLDVPYKVVINEAVALAKKFGATDSHKYINGVLDKAARELREAEVAAAS